MREIKFRGRDIVNGNWLYGNLEIPLLEQKNSKHYIIGYSYGQYQNNEVDYKSVGQFTGLKDKNGKEIYEGDIVYLPEHNHKGRVYLNVNHGWVVEGICMSVKVHNYKNIEVIGNIYEHSHLLESESNE